ncbi:MAG: stage II sporulation protein P [Firmicutes bacterium]|nr:stage II sporulation protein P [Candidatus Fermentithermobacillaceae bacterium]
MERGAWSPARWFLANALLVFLALVLASSYRVDATVPATTFGGDLSRSQPRFSLMDAVLSKTGPVHVLKAGFPLLYYAEESRHDEAPSSPAWELVSWLLGTRVRGPKDLMVMEFGRSSQVFEDSMPVYDLRAEWDNPPVLIILPPGGEATPVTVSAAAKPLVAVYHTHATESFLPVTGKNRPEDAFSDDPAHNMLRVGEFLVSELRKLGIPVVHSRTVHDAGSRVGAYARSEVTVKRLKETYPELAVLIDVHRDSQRGDLTTAVIKGKRYAKVMAVVATENPSWMANYSFARDVLDALDRKCPGISRGIFYESAVYNQKYSPMALLIEVGGVDNTLEECEASMKALASALREVLLARRVVR